MRCLRTLPVLVEIGRDIMKICPKAWVLNYTNPMSMLTWGMFKAVPGIRLVGLCHSVQGTLKQWADRLEIPVKDIQYHYCPA
jgi:alpha-galactosidase